MEITFSLTAEEAAAASIIKLHEEHVLNTTWPTTEDWVRYRVSQIISDIVLKAKQYETDVVTRMYGDLDIAKKTQVLDIMFSRAAVEEPAQIIV